MTITDADLARIEAKLDLLADLEKQILAQQAELRTMIDRAHERVDTATRHKGRKRR